MNTSTQLHCVYECLDNNIHQFTIVKATRQAVDDYLQQLNDILVADQINRILVDIRLDGMPPMRYAIRKGMQQFAGYEKVPTMRVAFLYEEGTKVAIGEALLSLLRLNSTRRAFKGKHREEAIRWLLKEEGS